MFQLLVHVCSAENRNGGPSDLAKEFSENNELLDYLTLKVFDYGKYIT